MNHRFALTDLFHIRSKHVILITADILHVLQNAFADILVLFLQSATCIFHFLLKCKIRSGMKNFPENFAPLLSF